MFGLSRNNSPLLGIDISTTAIKLIELSRQSSSATHRFQVEHFAIEPLPLNAVAEKKIADPEVIGQCIRKAVLQSGTKVKRAAVAVAGSAVITKTISLSGALTDAEMEGQILLEADQYIPYPLEEVNLDFDVIGPSANATDMVDVLLAASRRENVDDLVAALEIAGLTAVVVDVEAYAMENACSLLRRPDAPDGYTVAVLDIGAATTTLYVLKAGQIIYTREQNFGGRQLRDEVQRRYGLSHDEATRKMIAGNVAETYEAEVLGPFKEALTQQIGRALQFFYSGTTLSRVDQILLAGNPAGIPNIATLVEERLKLPAVVANPFSCMSLSSRLKAPDDLTRDAHDMMIAVGLALRGFD